MVESMRDLWYSGVLRWWVWGAWPMRVSGPLCGFPQGYRGLTGRCRAYQGWRLGLGRLVAGACGATTRKERDRSWCNPPMGTRANIIGL